MCGGRCDEEGEKHIWGSTTGSPSNVWKEDFSPGVEKLDGYVGLLISFSFQRDSCPSFSYIQLRVFSLRFTRRKEIMFLSIVMLRKTHIHLRQLARWLVEAILYEALEGNNPYSCSQLLIVEGREYRSSPHTFYNYMVLTYSPHYCWIWRKGQPLHILTMLHRHLCTLNYEMRICSIKPFWSQWRTATLLREVKITRKDEVAVTWCLLAFRCALPGDK